MDSIKSIESFFKHLSFDEKSHSYYVKGKRIPISASGVYEKFKKPFDLEGKSLKTALAEGVSQEEILERWKKKGEDACKLGSEAHHFGELYTFDRTLTPQNNFDKALVAFFKSVPDHVIPVKTELRMYHKKYNFAGTCDNVFYNKKTGKYIISDFKTNEYLFRNFGNQKMLGIFSDLLETNFNLYQVQLNLYKILLEQIKGVKVSVMKIVHLKPNGTFSDYTVEDFSRRLEDYLKSNYKMF